MAQQVSRRETQTPLMAIGQGVAKVMLNSRKDSLPKSYLPQKVGRF